MPKYDEYEDITTVVQTSSRMVLKNLDDESFVLMPMDVYVGAVDVHVKIEKGGYEIEYTFDEACLLYVGEIQDRKCLCDGH